MSDEQTPALEKYSHLTQGREIQGIKLTQHEACAVLMAYDYGIDNLSLSQQDQLALDSVIAKLKTEIWP